MKERARDFKKILVKKGAGEKKKGQLSNPGKGVEGGLEEKSQMNVGESGRGKVTRGNQTRQAESGGGGGKRGGAHITPTRED